MRALGLALMFIGLSPALIAFAEEFPYKAYVAGEDLYVRSGPGRNYYPTDKLPKGTEVEVWRHDPGGWYAIRPPKNSYSWVSSRYLTPTEDGLGKVTGENVVSRIGSRFSNVRDVIQVRLEPGEVVEILSEHNSGGQTWYKIAPPSGEFRWITGKFLDRQPPHDGTSDSRRRVASEKARRAREAEFQRMSYTADSEEEYDPEFEPEVYEEEEEFEEEYQPPRRSRARQGRRVAAKIEPVSYEVEEDDQELDSSPGQWAARGISVPTGRGRQMRSRNSQLEQREEELDEAFLTELDAIEWELAEMLGEEPTVWSFIDLKARAEALLDEANTAVDRGHVRRLLTRIAKMENIHQRYQQVGAVLQETDRQNTALSAPQQTPGAPQVMIPGAGAQEQAKFDGMGTLRPVVSKRPAAPQFALVDDAGVVQCFLTTSPTVNLQAYLGQRIGVYGTRGFIVDLNKPHVMVTHVQALP